MIRPVANPPTNPSSTSAFTTVVPTAQRIQEPAPRPFPQANYLPMPVPFYPNSWNNGGYSHVEFGMQMHQRHRSFHQKGTVNSQPILQMNPSVMPEVAGFYSVCNTTSDQIAVETLTHYVAWSEYTDETIYHRNVRSRAFIDGFGAALVCFKMLYCRQVTLARCPACSTGEQINPLHLISGNPDVYRDPHTQTL